MDTNQSILFQSQYSGRLYARAVQLGNGTNGYELIFPAKPETQSIPYNDIDYSRLLHAFHIQPDDIISIKMHTPDLIIELSSTDLVESITNVDYGIVGEYNDVRGVLVTSHNTKNNTYQNNNNVHTVSRCFFAQVYEDPVTGMNR